MKNDDADLNEIDDADLNEIKDADLNEIKDYRVITHRRCSNTGKGIAG
jgi:hypothetical protein